MKRITLFVVALFCASVFAQDLPRIGVYVTGNVGEDERTALGTRMLASLVNSGRYKGIERSSSFLAEIEKEQEKQRSGAIDDSQVSALGKQFGVKFVCIANITPAYGSFQVSARIVNVETAEIDFIGDASSPLKTMDDLAQASNEIIGKMFKEHENARPKPSSASEPPPAAAPELKPEPDVPERKARITQSNGISWTFANNFNGKIDLEKTEITKKTYSYLLDSWVPSDSIVLAYNKAPYHQGWGISSFFDVTYGGFAVDFTLGNETWSVEEKRPSEGEDSTDSIANYESDVFFMSFSLGLFGKYPIAVSDNITWFPVAGIYYGYDMHMEFSYLENEEGGRGPIAFFSEALWFKFGAGLDIALGEVFFLRSEVLYGIGIPVNLLFGGMMATEYDDIKKSVGHGLTVRVGLGWSKELSGKGKKK